MKKVMLIVNPTAGGETAPEYAKLAAAKLETLFDEVEIRETTKGGDAREFASEASINRYHSIFVMGGDGTVNEGISGIAEKPYRPNFGFFPLGTVNDLARALNIPLDPITSIETLNINNTSPLDIGKINDQYFMNVVGIGTIPEAINDVDSKDKTKFGKFAYFISGFKHLFSNTPHKFEIVLDGQIFTVESSFILIGLTNSIGGFESLLPNASADDGTLHFAYIKDSTLFDTIKAVPDLLSGVEEESKYVGYVQFQEGSIDVKEDITLSTNIDGDIGPTLPIQISILKHHLTVYTGIIEKEKGS